MSEEDLDNFTVADSRKWGLLSLAVGLVVYFVAQRYMITNRASVCALFVALMVFLVRFYWRLRAAIWFWLLVVVIFSIDMATVFLVPTGKWPNSMIVLAPIAAVQMAISIFLISTVESAIRKGKGSR